MLFRSWRELHWPPEDWLSTTLIDELSTSGRLLYPNVENVGSSTAHVTSPFLETYLERWYPDESPEKLDWHYESAQELIDLIWQNDGVPILAHPLKELGLTGYHAVEVFSGYAHGIQPTWEPLMMDFWDDHLSDNPRLYGVAVNDWCGPVEEIVNYSCSEWDTGKTILLADEFTVDSAKEALLRGSMFAVADLGEKDNYPTISRIDQHSWGLSILTDGDVSWIHNGERFTSGNDAGNKRRQQRRWHRFYTDGLDGYVRAEITNGEDTVFTQPWELSSLALAAVPEPSGSCLAWLAASLILLWRRVCPRS